MRVLLAGGGTGGHLYPALSIAQGLRKRDQQADVRFVGSRYGIEASILPAANEIFYPLNIKGFMRSISLKAIKHNLSLPLRFLSSYARSRKLLREFKPEVVVGTGGYASGIPLWAAQLRGIPTLLQEQNSYPGVTTRRLAPKARTVCITYPESAQYLTEDNWVITGNPVRFNEDIPNQKQGRRNLGLPPRTLTIFILGGSQGSHILNMHFRQVWKTYGDARIHLLWQTGPADYPRLQDELGRKKSITLIPYITDMASAYSAADLIICRAGAMTISELCFIGRPAVLIPLPSAAADHQNHNAATIAQKGAGLVVQQDTLAAGHLEKKVFKLMHNRGKLTTMGQKAQKLAHRDAQTKIVNEIMKLVN